jgi:hypothetical protein
MYYGTWIPIHGPRSESRNKLARRSVASPSHGHDGGQMTPIEIVLAFMDRINQRDPDQLSELMTEDSVRRAVLLA